MTTINDIDELKLLALKEKFYVITDGNLRAYIFAGEHPKEPNLRIAIWDADYTTAKVFSRHSFTGRTVFLKGAYNSQIIGNVMIAQLEEQVKAVNKIYINKEHIKN